MIALRPLLLAAFASLPLAASAGTPDGIVKAQLEAKGITFEVDGDGDFKCIFEVGSTGRTQVVFVRSSTATFGTLKVREIWSPGYVGTTDEFPAMIANQLLQKSNEVKLGGWVKQGKNAMFVVKLPADASAEQLLDGVQAAVESADAFELAITGKDDL